MNLGANLVIMVVWLVNMIQVRMQDATEHPYEYIQVDIIVLMDDSGSIDDHEFGQLTDFIGKMTEKFPMNGGKLTRLALITFSTDPVVHTPNGFVNTTEQFKEALDHARNNREKGGTQTQVALPKVKQFFLQYDERPDVPNVLLIMTDGCTNGEFGANALQAMADAEKTAKEMLDNGVKIFVCYVSAEKDGDMCSLGGNATEHQLILTGNNPDHRIKYDNFDQMGDEVFDAIKNEGKPVVCVYIKVSERGVDRARILPAQIPVNLAQLVRAHPTQPNEASCNRMDGYDFDVFVGLLLLSDNTKSTCNGDWIKNVSERHPNCTDQKPPLPPMRRDRLRETLRRTMANGELQRGLRRDAGNARVVQRRLRTLQADGKTRNRNGTRNRIDKHGWPTRGGRGKNANQFGQLRLSPLGHHADRNLRPAAVHRVGHPGGGHGAPTKPPKANQAWWSQRKDGWGRPCRGQDEKSQETTAAYYEDDAVQEGAKVKDEGNSDASEWCDQALTMFSVGDVSLSVTSTKTTLSTRTMPSKKTPK